jgi:putative addiction module component (TIGR02574 family)
MSLTRDQIKSAALSLAPAEREALAEELLLSVADADQAAIDAAWLEESYRRDADLASGRTSAKPVEEVIARLQSNARR